MAAQPLDRRADIWAAGVNLYALLTGQLPFLGRSEVETMVAIAHRLPPSPGQVCQGIAPALDAVVMRALEKNPDCRFQSAADMQAALEACLQEEPVGSMQLAGMMETLLVMRFCQSWP